jgi:hypothetical protein
MKARFRVQHEILSGMKYVQVVSRMGAKTKMQEMIVCVFPYFSNSVLSGYYWFVILTLLLSGLLLAQHHRQARVREEV